MSSTRLDTLLQAAVSEGVLPEQQSPIDQDARPWPVVLLTALGAWLAAIPLTGVAGLLLVDSLRHGAGVYVVGLLVLAATVAVLRSKTIPLFVEQLAVPGLLIAGCLLGFGVFRDMSPQGGACAMALFSLLAAALIPRPWLRVLLGGVAATMLVVALIPRRWFFNGSEGMFAIFWLAWHAVAALTGLAALARARLFAGGTGARMAAALESVIAGSLLCVLVALSLWSGMAFLVGATMDLNSGFGAVRIAPDQLVALQAASAVLALAAFAWLGRQWPSVRKPWCIGVAAVVTALAWFMPALGAVLLALSLCAASGRWRLASAAAVAATWIVSSFYYGLEWPLATKAMLLVAAGAVLGGLAWFASRSSSSGAASAGVAAIQAAPRHTRSGVALTLLAVLAVVNVGIWQKEQLAGSGATVFVELAPRDPRSLMQGDYMALNFRLPNDVLSSLSNVSPSTQPRVVAQRDSRGVASVLRLDDGRPLASDELRIELSFKADRWVLVSDAWMFKEGEEQRWAGARFGEVKVDGQGRALLVGLRGPKLEPL